LEGVIADVIEEVVPVATVCLKSKRWWSRELKGVRAKARRWGKIAKKYKMVDHLSHEEFQRARNDYRQLIKSTKKGFWENWLEEVSREQVWKANKFVTALNSDGGKARVPALKVMGDNGEGRMVKDNTSKSAALHHAFFYEPPEDNGIDPNQEYPPLKWNFELIQDEQIHRAIKKTQPFQSTRLKWHTQCSNQKVCPSTSPFPRAHILCDVLLEDIPSSVEAIQHHGPTKTWKERLHQPKHIPTNSTTQHHSKGTVVMCQGECYVPCQKTQFTAPQPIWGTTRLYSHRHHPHTCQLHQGCMAQGASCSGTLFGCEGEPSQTPSPHVSPMT
jgi:hypothetical protein